MTQLDKDRFIEAVAEAVRKERKDKTLTFGASDSFGLVGLDSLDVMNVVLEVESKLGVAFGEIDVRESDTSEQFYEKAVARLAAG